MISVLPFHLAAQQFAVPIDHVVRVIPMLLPTRLPSAPAQIAGVVAVHEQILPIIDIAHVLGQAELKIELWTPMLWLKSSQRDFLIPVTSVAEIIDIEPEYFIEADHPAINSRQLHGVLARADELVIIMDIEALLSVEDEAQLQQALNNYLEQVSAADGSQR